MTATVSRGQTYRGQYFQITKDTTVDSIGPLWYPGWGGRVGWGGWGNWDADPSPDFITHHTGHVWSPISRRRTALTSDANFSSCILPME
jgi:hypothetical protein